MLHTTKDHFQTYAGRGYVRWKGFSDMIYKWSNDVWITSVWWRCAILTSLHLKKYDCYKMEKTTTSNLNVCFVLPKLAKTNVVRGAPLKMHVSMCYVQQHLAKMRVCAPGNGKMYEDSQAPLKWLPNSTSCSHQVLRNSTIDGEFNRIQECTRSPIFRITISK